MDPQFYETVIPLIILVILAIVIVVMFILNKKKAKKDEIKNQSKLIKISNTLAYTKQHLKYKSTVTIQSALTVTANVLLIICAVLMIFLPIFKIKLELLDIDLYERNFSFFDNFMTILKEETSSTDARVDAQIIDQVIIFFFFVLFAVMFVVDSLKEFKPFNEERRAENVFKEVRLNKRVPVAYYGFYERIFIFAVFVALFGGIIYKNIHAEWQYISDTVPITQQVDRYLYYYEPDGRFLFKVFQNDFKFFNEISGIIAIPIIIFVIALVLYVVCMCLRMKLKKDILKEDFPSFNDEIAS